MNELYANYTAAGYWDLDEEGIDLTTAHKWWIKWDCLYVQKEENGDIEEYEGGAENDHDYIKHPVSLWLNGEEVNAYTNNKEAA